VRSVCDLLDAENPNIISRGSLLGRSLDKPYVEDARELNRILDEALENMSL
jgi:hypothetical protein